EAQDLGAFGAVILDAGRGLLVEARDLLDQVAVAAKMLLDDGSLGVEEARHFAELRHDEGEAGADRAADNGASHHGENAGERLPEDRESAAARLRLVAH